MRSGWNAAGGDGGGPGALEGHAVGGCRQDRGCRIARRWSQPHIGQCRRRRQDTTGCFATLDDGRNLVGVGDAGGHIGIGEGQTAEALAEGLQGGTVVAGEGVGDAWGRGPVARRHCHPCQVHLNLPRTRFQDRPFPKLLSEFLPRGSSNAVRVHRKDRVLARSVPKSQGSSFMPSPSRSRFQFR